MSSRVLTWTFTVMFWRVGVKTSNWDQTNHRGVEKLDRGFTRLLRDDTLFGLKTQSFGEKMQTKMSSLSRRTETLKWWRAERRGKHVHTLLSSPIICFHCKHVEYETKMPRILCFLWVWSRLDVRLDQPLCQSYNQLNSSALKESSCVSKC